MFGMLWQSLRAGSMRVDPDPFSSSKMNWPGQPAQFFPTLWGMTCDKMGHDTIWLEATRINEKCQNKARGARKMLATVLQ